MDQKLLETLKFINKHIMSKAMRNQMSDQKKRLK